jgi:hypothetical protein
VSATKIASAGAVAVALSSLSASAVAPTLGDTARTQIRANWKHFQAEGHVPAAEPPNGVSWDARITPPFPVAWPPTGDGLVAFYGYAAGLRFGLMDGEEVAAPWVKVAISAKTAPIAERLGAGLERLGPHGVRPLHGEALAIARSGGEAEAAVFALAAGTSVAPNPLVQRFYCQWLRDSGVGKSLRAKHTAFVGWLGCGE